uniref:Uncharacterized protein n=1 Tax=Glossina austeni TaxID=7395 RepID=A0A1A9VAF8_GLOAU
MFDDDSTKVPFEMISLVTGWLVVSNTLPFSAGLNTSFDTIMERHSITTVSITPLINSLPVVTLGITDDLLTRRSRDSARSGSQDTTFISDNSYAIIEKKNISGP